MQSIDKHFMNDKYKLNIWQELNPTFKRTVPSSSAVTV